MTLNTDVVGYQTSDDGKRATMLSTQPGVIPPMITPFRPDRSIDTETITSLANRMIDAGVAGLFPLGSSGEVSFLDSKQRRQVLDAVSAATKGRVPIMAGVIDLSRNRTLENIAAAADAGADYAVVTAPFYAGVNERDIEEHYRSVAKASPLPLVAYDIPVNVHNKLHPDLLVRLGQEGVITAVKDSSSVAYELRVLAIRNRQAGSPLTILTGTEVVVDADILIGADGVVPGLANVVPEEYVRLFNLSHSGEWEKAAELQNQLVELFQIIHCDKETTGPAQAIGAFKEAMHLLGMLPCPATAEPSFPLSEKARGEIKEIVDRYLAS